VDDAEGFEILEPAPGDVIRMQLERLSAGDMIGPKDLAEGVDQLFGFDLCDQDGKMNSGKSATDPDGRGNTIGHFDLLEIFEWRTGTQPWRAPQ
jgi:hypothetical protein